MALPRLLATVLAGLAASAAHSFAQTTLALFSFTGSSFASTDAEPNTVAGTLAVSGLGPSNNSTSGYSISSTTISGGTTPHLFVSHGAMPGDESTAISGGSYLGFSLTIDPAQTVTLAQMSLKAVLTVPTGSSATNSGTIFLRTSADNYASTVGSQTLTGATVPGSSSFTTYNYNLSGLGSVAGTIDFRVYLYDNVSTGTSGAGLRLDDITLTGTPIPEPGTYALMIGACSLGWVGTRRRPRGC